MPASTRFASYELDRRIASGSYGEVWIARDGHGRTVALKILHESVLGEPDSLRRFERESRTAIALRHPNLVAAFESGASQGRPFLASEFLPGGSVQDLLDREGRLPLARALPLFADILRGLDAIDRAGLVHRDLKPANVLLDSHARAKIADLGLVRPTAVQRTMLTAQGEIVGTPAYMAPEQITHGGEVDIRADLYAVGAMLYRSLTGELPFTAADVLSLLKAQIGQPTPDPADKLALPAAVSTFVRGLMAKRREDRPPTPAAALATIEELIGGEPSALGRRAESASGGLLSTLPDRPALPFTLADGPELAATIPNEEAAASRDSSTVQALDSALCLREESGAILFLYGAEELTLGRDSAQSDPRRICLRVLPAAANIENSMRLSGRQIAIRRHAGRWSVRDLGSTHGTLLDGAKLAANVEAELLDGAMLELAGVLELRVSLLAGADRAGDEGGGPSAPSLLLTRPKNGAHHRYLFVAAPVALDRSTRPIRVGSGPAILGALDGTLRWLASAPSALDPVPIRPDDPKT